LQPLLELPDNQTIKQSTAMLTVLLPLLAVVGNEHILFASDRVYAVLAVVLIVFFGFIAFLIYLERRVHDLEKKKKS
jgi:hypothetical protein